MRKLDYKIIKNNEEINLLIDQGNDVLKMLGFTEHSKKWQIDPDGYLRH